MGRDGSLRWRKVQFFHDFRGRPFIAAPLTMGERLRSPAQSAVSQRCRNAGNGEDRIDTQIGIDGQMMIACRVGSDNAFSTPGAATALAAPSN